MLCSYIHVYNEQIDVYTRILGITVYDATWNHVKYNKKAVLSQGKPRDAVVNFDMY